MRTKSFPIKCPSKEEFFKYYLTIVKPFLPGITDKEIDILAELLYQNYINLAIEDKEKRFNLILCSANRRLIENKLNIPGITFRNILTSLKAKGFLEENNFVKDYLLVIPDDNGLVINFNLTL